MTILDFSAPVPGTVTGDVAPASAEAPLRGGNRLPILAIEANQFAVEASRKTQDALIACIEAGKRLNEAKKIVGHRQFMTWVRANWQFSHGTAMNYMDLAEAVESEFFKFTTIVNLTMTGAVKEFREAKAAKRRKLHRVAPVKLPRLRTEKKPLRSNPKWQRPNADQILFVEWSTERYAYIWATDHKCRSFAWLLLDYTAKHPNHESSEDTEGETEVTWERMTLVLLHGWCKNRDGVERQELWHRDPVIMQMLRVLLRDVAYMNELANEMSSQIRRLRRELIETQAALEKHDEKRLPSVRLQRTKAEKQQAEEAQQTMQERTRPPRLGRVYDDIEDDDTNNSEITA